MMKSKTNTLNKFKKLYFKRFGYHHNINRHTTSFDNIDHNSNSLSGESNVPSRISTRTTNHSTTSSVPAIPMAPIPSTHAADSHPAANHLAPRQPTSNHTCTSHTWTKRSSISPNPPHPGTIIPSTKRLQLCHYPQILPMEACITSTEQAATKLPTQEADEPRSDVYRILKQLQQQHNKQCNLNPSQGRALTELKQDNTRVILTADKGVAMVIMDQQDYINKAQSLLQDTNTYKVLP